MRKLLIFPVLLIILVIIPNVQAITSYNIEIKDNTATFNTTFELYTSVKGEKVNFWNTNFIIPEGSVILSVYDSKAEITNYTVKGKQIHLQTNSGGLKEKEVVTIVYKLNNVVNKEYFPLKKVNLSLSAFGDTRPDVPDEQTFVTIKTDETLLSFIQSPGFSSQLEDNTLKLAGDGPVSFTIQYSDSGEHYDNYILFGKGDLTKADNAFGIVASVTGIMPEYQKIPVVSLPDNKYDNKINTWSAGIFSSGAIFIRDKNVEKDTFPAIMLHETAHAFNERVLRWQNTKIAWFDEGIAKYIEFLVNKKSNVRQAEIFGEPVKWRDGLSIYTLPSRSSQEELWNYYQDNQNFMKEWNTDSPLTREFGYAYSELVIREIINKNGPEALHPVFQGLLTVTEETELPDKYNSVILSFLDTDFEPCKSQSQELMDSCLKEINLMDPLVPSNVIIKGVVHNITIPEIEEPEEEAFHVTIIARILDFFDYIASSISGLFQ